MWLVTAYGWPARRSPRTGRKLPRVVPLRVRSACDSWARLVEVVLYLEVHLGYRCQVRRVR